MRIYNPIIDIYNMNNLLLYSINLLNYLFYSKYRYDLFRNQRSFDVYLAQLGIFFFYLVVDKESIIDNHNLIEYK